MKRLVGWWVLYLSTSLCAFSQVDTSYIYNTSMPYGTLDLRLAKSPTRYYYLQEGITFSYRESAPGVKTNTYTSMTTWNTSAYEQGNLREKNGTSDVFVMNYRLLKPKNYNASFSPGYPIIIMFHGAGESANCWVDARCHWATASYNPVTNSPAAPTDPNHKLLNNDRNLLHGGAQHLTAVNLAGGRLPDDPALPDRAFPGFVLFPQSLNGWGPHTTAEDAIRILRLLIKKYNIDENRVYVHGLSNGGLGVYQALKRAPWLFAAALPMSAIYEAGIINQGLAPEVSKVPLWIFQGGQDNNPTPSKTFGYVKSFREAGADLRYYMYPHLGHGTWNTAYNEPDFFTWILGKRKNNPHVQYGNPVICGPTQAGVRIEFSNGFFAYQWQRNGQLIADATGSGITATTPGTYRGRFSRKPNPSEADWEPWSDPVVVSEYYPEKPSVEVIGTAHLRGPGLASTDANNTVRLRSADSAELYMWYKDGSPVNFSGTDVDDTLRTATFTSAYTGGSGSYTLVTERWNCPGPPSDPVNIFFNNSSPLNIPLSAEAMNVRATTTASTIFLTWQDVSGLESGYEIWRRKAGTTDFRFVAKTGEDGISFLDKDLDPGTTYEYKLRAVSNTGRSGYAPSDDVNINYAFTTGPDTRTPPPPQDLRAVSNTLSSITLSWKPARDESSVKEYYVYYNSDSVKTGSDSTTFTLTGLPRNTAFTIRVRAVDYGNHLSQPSNQIIATTYLSGLLYKHSTGAWESLDDSAMVATWASPEFSGSVSNFTLQPRTQDDYFNFQFSGYLNIETEGMYYFSISSDDGSRLLLDGAVIADNDGIHTSRTVESEGIYLTAGPHPIEVQYFDDVGSHTLAVRYKGPGIGDGNTFVNIPDAALRSGTYVAPSPPAAPSGLTANGTGMERIALSWTFADDAQTDYEVYRATATSGPFEITIRAKGTGAVDSIALLPGTTYYYKVRTVNQNGSSTFSTMVSASTLADNEAPSAPGGLVMSGKTLTSAALTWQPSTDNVAVTKYEIYSGTHLLGTSSVPSFTVEGLAPETQYTITVVALDATGNRSAASAPLAIATEASARFYSLATGNLNDLSTWRSAADGTGTPPQNFTDNGQYFFVTNRTSTSLGGDWTLGGSASRVVVPAGVTLTVDHAFSARVELQGDAVLHLEHETAPALVKLSPASTVNFNGYTTVPATTYGNVILSGTAAKTFAGDTITVLGNLTVGEGLALKGSPHNTTHITLSGSLTLQGTRPETASDNAIDLELAGGPQSITTGSDLYLYRLTLASNSVAGISNPDGSAVKITLGSLQGGGLVLADGSRLSIGSHHLVLREAGVVNPGKQSGTIATDGGVLTIESSSAQHSYLSFDENARIVSLLEANLTGAGNVVVRSPLQVSEGVRVRSGTLASDGNIMLLGGAGRQAVIYEIGDGGQITGEVTVQQWLPPKGKVRHYLSAPTADVTVSEWKESIPAASLFYYQQAAGGWMPYPSAGGSDNAPIQRGVGYAALTSTGTDGIVLRSKGAPYQGAISFALAGGGEGTSASGWNFIGNPFASPIEWTNEPGAWTRSGISNVIAIRKDSLVDGAVRSQVIYYDLLLGGGIIPQGTGFWVKAYAGAPALTVAEEAKVNAEEPDSLQQPAKYLALVLEQGNVRDHAYVAFSSEATDGFDPQYDGRKLANHGMFNLFTLADDTVGLAVNHVSEGFCTKSVRLALADVVPGSYSFRFVNLASLSEIGEVALNDHYTGARIVLSDEPYVFSVTEDPATFGRDRFELVFTRDPLDLSGPQFSSTDICSSGTAFVTITNPQAGVLYQVVNASGEPISGTMAGSGAAVDVNIFPGALAAGPNQVRITAGFAGCDRQPLPGEITLNVISELTVITAGDVSICEGGDVTLEASGAPAGGFYKWFDSDGVVIEGETGSTFQVTDVSTETVYYVASAHPDGCESELAEIHIYADTLDMPVILTRSDTLYTDVTGYYQWTKDGDEIPGATLYYFVPQDEGVYTVIASNGGCFKESDPYQVGDPVTGIGDGINAEFTLSIYPVPSNGRDINLLLRSPRPDPVLIEILDAMGRLQFRGTMEAGALAQGVKLEPLHDGMYVVRITQAGMRLRKKLVVKH